MKTGLSWELCRDAFVALWRPLILVGALCVVAAPAHAQARYRIVEVGGQESQAQLTNGGRTLVIKGELGQFVYTYDPELNTQTAFGFSGEREPREVRWPRTGKGPILAIVGDRWIKIGDVQPVAPPTPRPRPKPQPPSPPPAPFPSRFWRAHSSAILDLDISHDGRYLASGDARGVTKMWDLATYREHGSWNQPGTGVAFRRGGNLAAGGAKSGSVGAVTILRANGNLRLPGVPQRVDAVAYRWDGELFAAGGMRMHPDSRLAFGAIQLWHDDGTSLHPIRTLQESAGAVVRSMAFGPNNQYLFTAGGGNENQSLGTVTRWQLSNYQSVQLARFQGVAYSISTAIQDARRDVLVAFGGVRRQGDRNVGFVTMIRPDDTKTEAQDAPVYAVALCRDGTQLAAGSGKFTLLWTGTNDAAIRLPTSGVVRSVVFSPDGSKLAAGGLDGIITVWNTRRPASAPSVVPVHRVQIKVIDGRTKQPIGDARITPQGGAGSCNLLAWYRPSAIHRFEATKPGRYTFVVRHKDYPAQTVQYQVGAKEFIQTVSLNRVVAPPTPPPTPKLVSLLLKVQHADGSLVADPSIQFTAGPGRETYKGEGAGGTLRYDVTKAGDYRVRVSKKGYTPQTVAVRAEVGGKPRTVVLHRIFKLLLTVLDTDKQPIAGPAIEIEPKERSELLSETRGTHVFSLTTAGTYKVTVSKKGFKGQTTTLSVRDRETRHTIEMGWGFELLLTVVDTDRNPIDGPTIGISGPGTHRKMGAKDGVHTYSLTSNGRYEITVSKPGYESKTKSLDVELGTRDDTFELKAIEYDLVVRVPGTGDLEVMAPAGRKATRTEEGVYTLRLRPGMYEVELKAGAVERQRVTIHNKDLELDFEPPVEDAVRELHKLLDTNADLRVDKKDYPTGWEQVQKFDTNGNGEFDLDEIAAWLKQIRQAIDKAAKPDPDATADDRVRDLQQQLDSNSDGHVDRNDYPTGWEQVKKFDTNGNGQFDLDELAAWLKQFDAEWDKAQKGATKTDVARKADPESDLDEIVRRLDTDQNGKVEKKDCSDLCWEQLRPLDADGNEIVSRDELRKRPTAPPPAKREAPEAVAGTLTIRRVGG